MKRLKEPGIFGLPNLITLARILTVPVLLVLMLFVKDPGEVKLGSKLLSLSSALVFGFSMLSDLLDGYFARRWNIVSTIGKFLDPLADKLVFLTAVIMLIPLGRMPAWLVVVFFIREMAVTALRSIAIDEGVIIQASKLGKYKSAFMSASAFCLLLHYDFLGVHWRMIGWALMWPALFMALYSGFDYCYGFYKAVKQKRRAKA